jgi:poly-gamma-glutamate synthesis protein (capsule biosynthesis protein)
MKPDHLLSLFLCGDVMTGRGIDQILPRPGNPALHERHIHDAREYVRLAEVAHGPIPRPVNFAYPWGDALGVLHRTEPDVRIVNLETSITCSEHAWPDKEVLYRMHPGNVGCLTAAHIDCCCLANNHVLDWGYPGLKETLWALDGAGVAHAGAGRDAAEAMAPAIIAVAQKGRVLVFGFGASDSGVYGAWGARQDRPGVNLLPDFSEQTARQVTAQMREHQRPGDVTVASIHWGSNWGYDLPGEHIAFARRLVDEGVDVVHGHSSHHVRTIEVYRDRLILYGCGDFLTDYEGIHGYEAYRGDLALMYLVTVDVRHGQLVEARLVPMDARRFRLQRAPAADAIWLRDLLDRLGAPFGTHVHLNADSSLSLTWR